MRSRTVLLEGSNSVNTTAGGSGGTTNTIAMFTGAQTLGDSLITQQGTTSVSTAARIFQGGGASGTFRSDTGIEVFRSTDAGYSAFMGANPGTTTNECFFTAAGYNASGVITQIGSMYYMFGSTHATTGWSLIGIHGNKNSTTTDQHAVFGGGQGIVFNPASVPAVTWPGDKGLLFYDSNLLIGQGTTTATTGLAIGGTSTTKYSRGIQFDTAFATGSVYGAIANLSGAATDNIGFYANISAGTNKWAFYANAGNYNVQTGGSTTISTGVGSVKMSTGNAATNTAWIPFGYAGTVYYIPAWTTNAP